MTDGTRGRAMPLHDWRDHHRWYSARTAWLVALADHLRPRLPNGYRVYLGSLPLLAGVEHERVADRPHIRTVRDFPPGSPTRESEPDPIPPDIAFHAVPVAPAGLSLLVCHHEVVAAVVELISPEDKAIQTSDAAVHRLLGYLRHGVSVMAVDVVPPDEGSIVARLANHLGLKGCATGGRVAVSLRADARLRSEPVAVDVWWRPLSVGRPLPALPLGLNPHQSVAVDLEGTYMRAAADVYLS